MKLVKPLGEELNSGFRREMRGINFQIRVLRCFDLGILFCLLISDYITNYHRMLIISFSCCLLSCNPSGFTTSPTTTALLPSPLFIVSASSIVFTATSPLLKFTYHDGVMVATPSILFFTSSIHVRSVEILYDISFIDILF